MSLCSVCLPMPSIKLLYSASYRIRENWIKTNKSIYFQNFCSLSNIYFDHLRHCLTCPTSFLACHGQLPGHSYFLKNQHVFHCATCLLGMPCVSASSCMWQKWDPGLRYNVLPQHQQKRLMLKLYVVMQSLLNGFILKYGVASLWPLHLKHWIPSMEL